MSVPPRPSVVISLVSWLTPWNPATITMWPSAMAVWIRPGVTSMILALPCTESVITPAWEPVKERAVKPRSEMAIATRAIEIRSPAVSSMSSSRAGGTGLTPPARSSSSSVVSPIAETATTTSLPAFFCSTIRRATRFTAAASESDEPPYFCTTMPTTGHSTVESEAGAQGTGWSVSSASATAISSASSSKSTSASSLLCATTECSALRTPHALVPHEAR